VRKNGRRKVQYTKSNKVGQVIDNYLCVTVVLDTLLVHNYAAILK